MYRIIAACVAGLVLGLTGCSRPAPETVLSESDAPTLRPTIPAVLKTVDDISYISRAEMSIKARVASTTAYDYDTLSNVAPKDVVLAWGPALASSVLNGIDITQNQRWFTWKPRAPLTQPPLPGNILDKYLANMHLIGADAKIAKVLRNLRVDDAVVLEGVLVDLKGGIFREPFYTSLSLTDLGLSSSETFYVTAVQILN